MKKNIVMLSNLDLWSIEEGKGAPSFYNTVKAYADSNDWDITLIQPRSKYRKNYQVEGCKMVKFNNNIFDFFNKIPKIRFLMKFISFHYLNHQFYRKASKLINKQAGQHIIYAYEVHAVKAAHRIARKYKLPLVTRFQGTILTNYSDKLFNKIINFPHFGALKQRSDLVIMTNDGTKGNEVIKRLNNESKKILFWKNGQTPTKSESEISKARKEIRRDFNIDEEAPVLLTVSRLSNWKRVDRAINALSKIILNYPKAKLIIVGNGDEFDNLNNLSKELSVEENVIFTGGVKQEDVWKYYSASDIFLSLYDLSNVGNPLMEAMRYSKAIITIDNGDTGRILKNNVNGILISPDKLYKIPVEFDRLMKNKSLIEELGRSAFEYAKKNFWTWDDRMNAELFEVAKLTKRSYR